MSGDSAIFDEFFPLATAILAHVRLHFESPDVVFSVLFLQVGLHEASRVFASMGQAGSLSLSLPLVLTFFEGVQQD